MVSLKLGNSQKHVQSGMGIAEIVVERRIAWMVRGSREDEFVVAVVTDSGIEPRPSEYSSSDCH